MRPALRAAEEPAHPNPSALPLAERALTAGFSLISRPDYTLGVAELI
jgi:hypothetical protein